jgi:hypothetical protein
MFIIEKGIRPYQITRSKIVLPLAQMEVGESFKINPEHLSTARQQSATYGVKNNKLFSVRINHKTQEIRVFRLG